MPQVTSRCIVRRGLAGLGLFARRHIPRGAFVIAYTGPRLSAAAAARRGGRYLFALSDGRVIDGNTPRNLARYINHSCDPNCEAVEVTDAAGRRHIKIYALRDIAPGEELTYDYGHEYVRDFIAPHGCRCAVCHRATRRA